jgi:drug/metabolite transporter (DMT)-like permease
MNSALMDESRGERVQAIGFLIATAILWSSAGLLIKMISWNPIAIAGMRSAIATLVLLVFLRRPHLTWSSAQIGGAVAFAATVILFVLANKLTTFACFVLFMRKQKNDSPLESVFLGNILTALIGLPFMFQAMPSPSSWVGLVLSGVLQLGLSHVLYATAIKHVTALEAILIAVVEPILNPVWVLLVMGETPGPWALLGGFVVLASVTIRYVVGQYRISMSLRGTK